MPDLADAFAPPFVEEVYRPGGDETIVFTFPRMDMDDWAACSQQLKANRRRDAETKLLGDVRLSPTDRHWLLMRLDDEPVTFMFAFHYRTETPVGIKSTLKKSLQKFGSVTVRKGGADENVPVKSDADADKWAKLISPVRQRELAKLIADPPVEVPKPDGDKDDADPNAEGGENPTGASTPPSSDATGPASAPEA